MTCFFRVTKVLLRPLAGQRIRDALADLFLERKIGLKLLILRGFTHLDRLHKVPLTGTLWRTLLSTFTERLPSTQKERISHCISPCEEHTKCVFRGLLMAAKSS